MIFDLLENARLYSALNIGFPKAMEFLLSPGLEELPVGKYKIEGESLYAMVAKDHGRRKEDALLETHEKYIDIQLVLAGTDHMGWKPKSSCKNPSGGYDKDDDIQFFTDVPDVWFPTGSGFFAIFFPEDAHMPLISEGEIHKVVVKVSVDRKSI